MTRGTSGSTHQRSADEVKHQPASQRPPANKRAQHDEASVGVSAPFHSRHAFPEASALQLDALDHSLVQFRQCVMQRVAAADTHEVARRGASGGGGPLPYGDAIQRSFGRHDISGITAHSGDAAQQATESLGAHAYATGSDVVLGAGVNLHTVAHEAAHVVQQRSGVQLKGGVGAAGDRYEQHADRVADLVVKGASAEHVLNEFAGASARKATPSTQAKSLQFVRRSYSGDSGWRKIDTRMGTSDVEFIRAAAQALSATGNPGAAQTATVSFSSGGDDWVFELTGGQRWDHMEYQLSTAITEAEEPASQDSDSAETETATTEQEGAPGIVEATTRESRTARAEGAAPAQQPFRLARRVAFPTIQLVSLTNPSPFIDSFQIQITSNLEIGEAYAPQPAAPGSTAAQREADEATQDQAHLGSGRASLTGSNRQDGTQRVGVATDGALLAMAQERWHSLEGFPISDQLSANTDGEASLGVQLNLSDYLFEGMAFQFSAVDISRDDGIRVGLLELSQGLSTPVFTETRNGQRIPMKLSGSMAAQLDPNWTAIAAHFSGEAATVGDTGVVLTAGGGAVATGVAAAAVLGGLLFIGGTMWALHRAAEQGRVRGLQTWYTRAYADRLAARVFGTEPHYNPDLHDHDKNESFVNGRNDAHEAVNNMAAAQQAQLRAHYQNRRGLEEAVRHELSEQFSGR